MLSYGHIVFQAKGIVLENYALGTHRIPETGQVVTMRLLNFGLEICLFPWWHGEKKILNFIAKI